MGDRAIVVVKSDKDREISPQIYVHWDGYRVPSLIHSAAPGLRRGDLPYTVARLIGHFHDQIEGNTGLGVFNTHWPEGTTHEDRIKLLQTSDRFDHGDNGVFIFDLDTGEITQHQGFSGSRNDEIDPVDVEKIPT